MALDLTSRPRFSYFSLFPGSFLGGGFLYKHMNGKLIIVLSLLLGGLGTIIVPDFAPDFWIAHFGQFVTGFSYGTLEVGELGHTAIRCLPLK